MTGEGGGGGTGAAGAAAASAPDVVRAHELWEEAEELLRHGGRARISAAMVRFLQCSKLFLAAASIVSDDTTRRGLFYLSNVAARKASAIHKAGGGGVGVGGAAAAMNAGGGKADGGRDVAGTPEEDSRAQRRRQRRQQALRMDTAAPGGGAVDGRLAFRNAAKPVRMQDAKKPLLAIAEVDPTLCVEDMLELQQRLAELGKGQGVAALVDDDPGNLARAEAPSSFPSSVSNGGTAASAPAAADGAPLSQASGIATGGGGKATTPTRTHPMMLSSGTRYLSAALGESFCVLARDARRDAAVASAAAQYHPIGSMDRAGNTTLVEGAPLRPRTPSNDDTTKSAATAVPRAVSVPDPLPGDAELQPVAPPRPRLRSASSSSSSGSSTFSDASATAALVAAEAEATSQAVGAIGDTDLQQSLLELARATPALSHLAAVGGSGGSGSHLAAAAHVSPSSSALLLGSPPAGSERKHPVPLPPTTSSTGAAVATGGRPTVQEPPDTMEQSTLFASSILVAPRSVTQPLSAGSAGIPAAIVQLLRSMRRLSEENASLVEERARFEQIAKENQRMQVEMQLFQREFQIKFQTMRNFLQDFQEKYPSEENPANAMHTNREQLELRNKQLESTVETLLKRLEKEKRIGKQRQDELRKAKKQIEKYENYLQRRAKQKQQLQQQLQQKAAEGGSTPTPASASRSPRAKVPQPHTVSSAATAARESTGGSGGSGGPRSPAAISAAAAVAAAAGAGPNARRTQSFQPHRVRPALAPANSSVNPATHTLYSSLNLGRPQHPQHGQQQQQR